MVVTEFRQPEVRLAKATGEVSQEVRLEVRPAGQEGPQVREEGEEVRLEVRLEDGEEPGAPQLSQAGDQEGDDPVGPRVEAGEEGGQAPSQDTSLPPRTMRSRSLATGLL